MTKPTKHTPAPELLEALEFLSDEAYGLLNRPKLLDEAIMKARAAIAKAKGAA